MYIDPTTAVSLSDKNEFAVTLFPSPATEYVTLSDISGCNKTVVITDLSGKVVFETRTSAVNESLDLSALNSGIYLVSVITDDTMVTRKLVLH